LSPRVTAFVNAARRAGIDATASEDIRRAIWEKFIFLAPFSGVTTVARLPKGPAFACPETHQLFVDAVGEVVAVARASGVRLPEDHAAKTVAFVDRLPAEMKPSLLHDLEHGKPLEVEFLSGAVASLGAKLGVPTPAHRAIYAALKPHAAGRPGV
jgi:2-dehydropantoate 2-reductase